MTEDSSLLQLYFDRDEDAIRQTEAKYGHYLTALAARFLPSAEDAAETVNDAYLDAWNSIPPHRPEKLGAYMAKLTRRRAVDRLRHETAARRGGGEALLSFDELSECIEGENTESALEAGTVREVLTSFLSGLSETHRRLFLCRYFYAMSLCEIGKVFEMPEGRAANILLRLRKKLREALSKEGVFPLR